MRRFQQRLPSAISFALVAALVFSAYHSKSAKTYPDALLEKINTPDGAIIIFEQDGLRMMTFNEDDWNYVESAWEPDDPGDLPVEYMRYLSAALMYPPASPERMLMIGMGGGSLTTYLHRYLPNADITAVEIDPHVVAAAEKYFGFAPDERYRAVVMDGREYLNQQNEPYDLIILDAFSDQRIPDHLAGVDFYREAAAHLTPGGAVAQNLETTNSPSNDILAAMTQAFDHLDIYRASRNFVLIGYNGEARDKSMLRQRARDIQSRFALRYAPEDFLTHYKKLK